jgi:hypothetical protein
MNDNEYTLTRSAFAKSIGKTIGSVKQAMRRGNYKDQYVVRNGQYFFRPGEGLRENRGPTYTAPKDSSKWTPLEPRVKDEYDKAMEEAKDNFDWSKKYY